MRVTETEAKYVNENALHFMQVIEALEHEPVSIKRVSERTQLSYDKVRRCLISAKARGWAREIDQAGWTLGHKAVRVFGGGI